MTNDELRAYVLKHFLEYFEINMADYLANETWQNMFETTLMFTKGELKTRGAQ
ncbi:hypothetical protein [Amycolatopsis sp. lyj-112]|uniref:hypothetical protein n=1 Tax=Amycolatopsis sp. lyj-112 TaxID=2789288 RepID=UPI003978D297